MECVSCGLQVSATSRTIFDKTRTPLTTWFQVIWWMAQQNNLASAVDLQHIFGLNNYETTWKWLNKLRTALANSREPRLSGRVRVDLFPLSWKSPSPGVAVAMVNRAPVRRLRTAIISEPSASAFEEFIANNVDSSATLVLRAGGELAKCNLPKYKIELVDRLRESEFDGIDEFAKSVRAWRATPHGGSVRPKHFNLYLAELAFRFNYRTTKDEGARFLGLMNKALDASETGKQEQAAEANATSASETFE